MSFDNGRIRIENMEIILKMESQQLNELEDVIQYPIDYKLSIKRPEIEQQLNRKYGGLNINFSAIYL